MARPLSHDTDLRFERKIRLERTEPQQARCWIREHPAHFMESFPSRWINSLYFDSPRLKCYEDHVNGVTPRKKVRFRWYGDVESPASPIRFEIKLRRGRLTYKSVVELGSLSISQLFSPIEIRDQFQRLALPELFRELACHFRPTLLTRYHRCYLHSRQCPVRITLDSVMTFAHPRPGHLVHTHCRDHAVVLEIKYAQGNADAGQSVCDRLPMSLSKSSKYVTGIGLLRGHA